MRRSDFLRLSGLAMLGALAVACTPESDRGVPPATTRVLVPAAAGGGYDVTVRTMARLLLEEGIIDRPLEPFNVPGGGGVLGLARVLAEVGNSDLLLGMGLGVVGAAAANAPHLNPAEATPLARLTSEPGVMVVPASSGIGDGATFLRAWSRAPATVRVGGGSSVGGPDYLFTISVARAVGIRLDEVDFISYSGAGDVLTGALTGAVDVGFAGAGEMRPYLDTGDLRALAVSAPGRVGGIDAPTLIELGVPLEFENWRGILGPPGMPESARRDWIARLRLLRETTAWTDALETNGWRDSFLDGEDFREFLTEQRALVMRTLRG